MDTIQDFVDYLSDKEMLFQSGVSVIAPGENELLAHPASYDLMIARIDVIPSKTVESENLICSFCIIYKSLSYIVIYFKI